jgi:hypothetical protein
MKRLPKYVIFVVVLLATAIGSYYMFRNLSGFSGMQTIRITLSTGLASILVILLFDFFSTHKINW